MKQVKWIYILDLPKHENPFIYCNQSPQIKQQFVFKQIPGKKKKTEILMIQTTHMPKPQNRAEPIEKSQKGTFFSPRKLRISMALFPLVMLALMGKWAYTNLIL